MTADLKTLAERVEGLTGPCRETDALVFVGLLLLDVPEFQDIWGHWTTEQREKICPSYTASLDAVLALIGEKLPGAAIAFEGPDENGTWWGTVGGGPVIACRTPALALLAATLRALGESHDR